MAENVTGRKHLLVLWADNLSFPAQVRMQTDGYKNDFITEFFLLVKIYNLDHGYLIPSPCPFPLIDLSVSFSQMLLENAIEESWECSPQEFEFLKSTQVDSESGSLKMNIREALP